jgi:hypothetical protein
MDIIVDDRSYICLYCYLFISMETILTILEIELKMSVIKVQCHLMHRNTQNGSWWVSIDDIYIMEMVEACCYQGRH